MRNIKVRPWNYAPLLERHSTLWVQRAVQEAKSYETIN